MGRTESFDDAQACELRRATYFLETQPSRVIEIKTPPGFDPSNPAKQVLLKRATQSAECIVSYDPRLKTK